MSQLCHVRTSGQWFSAKSEQTRDALRHTMKWKRTLWQRITEALTILLSKKHADKARQNVVYGSNRVFWRRINYERNAPHILQPSDSWLCSLRQTSSHHGWVTLLTGLSSSCSLGYTWLLIYGCSKMRAPSTEELLLSNEKGGWCLGRCFYMNHSTFTRGANIKHDQSLYKPFINQAGFRKTDRKWSFMWCTNIIPTEEKAWSCAFCHNSYWPWFLPCWDPSESCTWGMLL